VSQLWLLYRVEQSVEYSVQSGGQDFHVAVDGKNYAARRPRRDTVSHSTIHPSASVSGPCRMGKSQRRFSSAQPGTDAKARAADAHSLSTPEATSVAHGTTWLF
jgi:hypothetical protein